MFRKVLNPGINMSDKTEFANLTKDLISVILDTIDYQTANVLEKASKDHYTKTVPSGWVMHKEYTDPTQDVHYGVCIKAPISDAPTKFKYFCIYLKGTDRRFYISCGSIPPTEGTMDKQYTTGDVNNTHNHTLVFNSNDPFFIYVSCSPNHIFVKTSLLWNRYYDRTAFLLTERTRVQPWDTASSNHVPVVAGAYNDYPIAPIFPSTLRHSNDGINPKGYFGVSPAADIGARLEVCVLVDGVYKFLFFKPTFVKEETIYGAQHPDVNIFCGGSHNRTGIFENNLPTDVEGSIVLIDGVEYMFLKLISNRSSYIYVKME